MNKLVTFFVALVLFSSLFFGILTSDVKAKSEIDTQLIHPYEFWLFEQDGDYMGWQVHNTQSTVSNSWLTLRPLLPQTQTAILSLPNHQINMYMSDASKYLMVVAKASKTSTLSSSTLSLASQRARFTFTYSNGRTSAPVYFSIPINNVTQYYWLYIGDHTPIVINNLKLEFINMQPNTTVSIDEIQALDRME